MITFSFVYGASSNTQVSECMGCLLFCICWSFFQDVVAAVVRYVFWRILLTQLLLYPLVAMCVSSYWMPFAGQVTSAMSQINIVYRFVQKRDTTSNRMKYYESGTSHSSND